MWKINFVIRNTNQLNLMIVLKLIQFHFLLQTLIYRAENLIVLHLKNCIESIDIDKNQIIL